MGGCLLDLMINEGKKENLAEIAREMFRAEEPDGVLMQGQKNIPTKLEQL
jgi:hypothetical protein